MPEDGGSNKKVFFLYGLNGGAMPCIGVELGATSCTSGAQNRTTIGVLYTVCNKQYVILWVRTLAATSIMPYT